MQNLFVQENEEFSIGFTVATDEKGTIYCDLNRKSMEESLKGVENMEIQDYKAVFKRPSFGGTTELYEKIFSVGADGFNFNPILIRQKTIIALIKSWNLKGKEEKPTEEEIKSLHPIIATVISIQLEAEIGYLNAQ